jgi:hypothetical protein
MRKPNSSRKPPAAARAANRKSAKTEAPDHAFHAHLIRIPDTDTGRRALLVLGEVRVPYSCLSEDRYLVHTDHLEMLRKEKIPFEVLA